MSISLDYATSLGAWYDKEGFLHWPISGTADVTPRYCPSCSQPEHGNLACDYAFAIALDLEQSVLPVTYRVIDDRLFEVHPGAPMSKDDHCCLCAYRRQR